MMSPIDKTTIADVAKAAGVSIATVSRAMNHRHLVKPQTAEKVFAAMQALGYELPEFTENLVNDGGLIIVNAPSLDSPFYSEIMKGATTSASRHGYHLLIHEGPIDDTTFNSLTSLLKARQVSGLITLNYIPPALLGKLAAAVPLVQCCEYNEDFENIPFVSTDDLKSTKMVMDHIFSTGRRQIAFLSGPLNYKYTRQRKKEYLRSLENVGIEPNPNWIVHLPMINFDIAFSAATQLLRSANPPDAIFTVSDLCAAAVIKAAHQLELNVPDDLVVTGFDNVDISVMTSASITTVNLPRFQLGFIACDFLVELIGNPQAASQGMLLPTELISRESTQVKNVTFN